MVIWIGQPQGLIAFRVKVAPTVEYSDVPIFAISQYCCMQPRETVYVIIHLVPVLLVSSMPLDVLGLHQDDWLFSGVEQHVVDPIEQSPLVFVVINGTLYDALCRVRQVPAKSSEYRVHNHVAGHGLVVGRQFQSLLLTHYGPDSSFDYFY